MKGVDIITNKRIITEYYQKGYNLIPLQNNSKIPAIRWKQNQYKKAGFEDIFHWLMAFDEPNFALITGKKLVVIDLDEPSKLSELKKLLPGIEKTTRVKTKRGFHFYFINNNKHKISSTNNLFNLGIELKADGRYVVCPPSKVDGFIYNFEVPLSEIKPLPKQIIEGLERRNKGITLPEEGKQAPGVEYKKRKILSLPRYNGQDRYCIKQILDRNLSEGERDNSLFILYNLLLQNKNNSEHAKKIVTLKNNSLLRPLTDTEMKKA